MIQINKPILPLLIILLAACNSSQDKIVYNDEGGIQLKVEQLSDSTKLITDYYPSGEKKLERLLLNNEDIKAIYYDPAGNVESIEIIKSNILIAKFFDKGELLQMQFFDNDDELFFIKQYDSLGSTEMAVPLFEIDKDTLTINDTLSVKIKLFNDISDLEIEAVYKKDTISVPKCDDIWYCFDFSFDRVGDQKIDFLFKSEIAPDSLGLNRMTYAKSFYVTE